MLCTDNVCLLYQAAGSNVPAVSLLPLKDRQTSDWNYEQHPTPSRFDDYSSTKLRNLNDPEPDHTFSCLLRGLLGVCHINSVHNY